ncbi:MAG: Asp-tRNA(Asn)/Glu-tRNA(Gln) amidotransferase subunit GatA [Alphaproteobacteria bacterium GM7ARS4]|nr:Asp-tRNA(Asn)/Glu-tRNA(Gln) amidotransferase subunit GatA [Alphaproteobacteria bacterium GM7ARS4]
MRHMTLHAVCEHLRKKTFSARELTKYYYDRIKERKETNAYITLCEDHAYRQADASDRRRAKEKQDKVGLLEGIPFAIKDLFCSKGIRTTAASSILADFVPSYESTVTSRLWRCGAILLGKTNMDEFAMGSASNTGCFGAVVNPWHSASHPHKDLSAGGSSGGSAAAVADDLCVASLGSDTGGSIRQPASLCGVVGLKPSYGRCSRYGMVAFASSLDQAGCFTRSVRDAGLILQAIGGVDPQDATSSHHACEDITQDIGKNIASLRVGIPKEYHHEKVDSAIIEAWHKAMDILKGQGAQLVDVSLPHTRYALPAYYIIAPAEASSNLARYDGIRYGMRAQETEDIETLYRKTRSQGFGEEVRRRLMIGTYVLSAGYYDAYYLKAAKVRARVQQDFVDVFKQVDVLLTPTTPNAAFPLDMKDMDAITMYLNDILTVPASLAGLPAISVPISYNKERLPLGVHVISRRFDERTLLRLAHVLEQECDDTFTPAMPS